MSISFRIKQQISTVDSTVAEKWMEVGCSGHMLPKLSIGMCPQSKGAISESSGTLARSSPPVTLHILVPSLPQPSRFLDYSPRPRSPASSGTHCGLVVSHSCPVQTASRRQGEENLSSSEPHDLRKECTNHSHIHHGVRLQMPENLF